MPMKNKTTDRCEWYEMPQYIHATGAPLQKNPTTFRYFHSLRNDRQKTSNGNEGPNQIRGLNSRKMVVL
jgi:hypothetical protein